MVHITLLNMTGIYFISNKYVVTGDVKQNPKSWHINPHPCNHPNWLNWLYVFFQRGGSTTNQLINMVAAWICWKWSWRAPHITMDLWINQLVDECIDMYWRILKLIIWTWKLMDLWSIHGRLDERLHLVDICCWSILHMSMNREDYWLIHECIA